MTNLEQSERAEAIEQLEDIKMQIRELAAEAFQLATSNGAHEGRAKGYWYAQLVMALDDDHEYVGRGACTLQDSIDEIKAAGDGQGD